VSGDRLPIVVLAPEADEATEARLFADGAADVVVTSLRPLALAARLGAILSRT
jgi:DNA-binding response OmpR family regulator